MGRTRQREGGLGCLSLGSGGDDILIGRGALRPGAACLSGEVASVEHDQHLPGADAVARYGTDLSDWCGDPGHERGRRARLNDTAGLERVRDLGHRHGGGGDWHRVRRRLGYGLRTAGAGRQGQAGDEGDAREH